MGMILSYAVGTLGTGPERYTPFLPFVLAPGATLSLKTPATLSYGSLTIRLQELHTVFALSAEAAPTLEAAHQLLLKLQAALIWFSLKRQIGISYSKALQTLHLTKPTPIAEGSSFKALAERTGWTHTDGHYDADKAAVLPEHMRLVRWETGRATISLGFTSTDVFQALKEGLEFNRPEKVVQDAKLKLAVEIFAAHRFEPNRQTQFLTLVTALEALLPGMIIPIEAQQALSQAQIAVTQLRDRYASGGTEWNAVDHLLSRVAGLKQQSISRTLHHFIEIVGQRHPLLAPNDIQRKLKKAYETRSKLVHDGIADEKDINEHHALLSTFVPKLLQVLYSEAAS